MTTSARCAQVKRKSGSSKIGSRTARKLPACRSRTICADENSTVRKTSCALLRRKRSEEPSNHPNNLVSSCTQITLCFWASTICLFSDQDAFCDTLFDCGVKYVDLRLPFTALPPELALCSFLHLQHNSSSLYQVRLTSQWKSSALWRPWEPTTHRISWELPVSSVYNLLFRTLKVPLCAKRRPKKAGIWSLSSCLQVRVNTAATRRSNVQLHYFRAACSAFLAGQEHSSVRPLHDVWLKFFPFLNSEVREVSGLQHFTRRKHFLIGTKTVYKVFLSSESSQFVYNAFCCVWSLSERPCLRTFPSRVCSNNCPEQIQEEDYCSVSNSVKPVNKVRYNHAQFWVITQMSGCHTHVTVYWVRCGGPITNADFLCRAVRSTRGDHALRLEYSSQTLSCFPSSGHLHSLHCIMHIHRWAIIVVD